MRLGRIRVGGGCSSGAIKATYTIVSATGELAGLDGVLRQVGKIETPSGPFGTYSGQIHFGGP